MSKELKINHLQINELFSPPETQLHNGTWFSEPSNYLFILYLKYNKAELGQGICVISLFAAPSLVLDRVAFTHCSLGDRCEFLLNQCKAI